MLLAKGLEVCSLLDPCGHGTFLCGRPHPVDRRPIKQLAVLHHVLDIRRVLDVLQRIANRSMRAGVTTSAVAGSFGTGLLCWATPWPAVTRASTRITAERDISAW
jgi:hypothetical protein